MSSVFAICRNPDCGTLLQLPSIFSEVGAGFAIIGNGIYGPCTTCGGEANILKGTYEYSNGIISLIDGPKESLEIYEEVRQLLEQLKLLSSTKEEALQEIEKISPRIAELFKAIMGETPKDWIDSFIKIVGFLILIQTSYLKEDETKDLIIQSLVNDKKELQLDKRELRQENEESQDKLNRH